MAVLPQLVCAVVVIKKEGALARLFSFLSGALGRRIVLAENPAKIKFTSAICFFTSNRHPRSINKARCDARAMEPDSASSPSAVAGAFARCVCASECAGFVEIVEIAGIIFDMYLNADLISRTG